MLIPQRKQSGFTIIELLIVIVVIAILAAITLVAYNNIQNRAYISSADVELTNIAKQTQMYYVDNSVYPTSAAVWKSILQAANVYSSLSSTKKDFLICSNATSFGVAAGVPVAPSSNGDPYYYVNSVSGGAKVGSWDASITGTYYLNKMCGQPTLMPVAATYMIYGSQL